jgi:hypothetical protein
MESEERNRFEVLLEDVLTRVKAVAEGHGALVQRFDRLDVSFEKLDKKVDTVELFAIDAQRRLKRIEGHLQLNGTHRSSPRPPRAVPSTRRKKS